MSMQDIKWAVADAWYRWCYCPIKGHWLKFGSHNVCVRCNKYVPRHRA